MTQLDCKRKWRKNKQKQIQKSKQISLLWMVLICPRKEQIPEKQAEGSESAVVSHLVKEVPLAGFLHTRLSGHLLGGGPTPAQVLALLEGEKKKKKNVA